MDDNVKRARMEAREKAAFQRRHSRDGSGYLHQNPTGVSSTPSAADASVFASPVLSATKDLTLSHTHDLRQKARAGEARMLVKKASCDATETAMKIDAANQLEAQKQLALHAEILGR